MAAACMRCAAPYPCIATSPSHLQPHTHTPAGCTEPPASWALAYALPARLDATRFITLPPRELCSSLKQQIKSLSENAIQRLGAGNCCGRTAAAAAQAARYHQHTKTSSGCVHHQPAVTSPPHRSHPPLRLPQPAQVCVLCAVGRCLLPRPPDALAGAGATGRGCDPVECDHASAQIAQPPNRSDGASAQHHVGAQRARQDAAAADNPLMAQHLRVNCK